MIDQEWPDHERRVLYHCLSQHRHLEPILERITPEHFLDPHCAQIFQLVVAWRHTQGYALTVDSCLQQIEARAKKDFKEPWTRLVASLLDYSGSTKADLDNSTGELCLAHRKRLLLTHTSSLVEKLNRGAVDISAELQGLWDASNPDTVGTYRNVGLSVDRYRRIYAEAARSDAPLGHPTTFAGIDRVTNGIRPGKLWIWAAFTSQGKTAVAKEIAYRFAIDGKRVLFVSLEMDEEDLMTSWIARHSHEILKRLPETYKGPPILPLKENDIRDGKLDAIGEKIYGGVLDEFEKNGFPVTVWVPDLVRLSDIRRRVSVEQLVQPLDLVIVDYLSLCAPERQRYRENEEVGELMREAKRIARAEKVPVLGLHQISRLGYLEALKRGFFQMNDLSGSAEVERNADVVCWNLMSDEMRASREILMGVMKCRQGELLTEGYYAYADFATGLVADRQGGERTTSFYEQFME